MAERNGTPPLWKSLDFQFLWIGSAISVLGSRISSIAYPLLVLALTGSASDAGLVGFTATMPHLLFQLPAGALADRCNRKRVMIACDAGRAMALGSIVLALLFDELHLLQIMIVSFIEGTLFVLYDAAEPAAVRNLVHPRQLPLALSQVEARERGTLVIGRPLGGLLFDLSRWVPFLADTLSYLISLTMLLLIKKQFQIERADERQGMVKEIAAAVIWLWKQPFIRATTLLVAGTNMLFQALTLLLIVTAKQQGASAALVGVIFAMAGVGGVLGALLAPWLQRRLSMKVIVVVANWGWALLMPLIAITDNLYALGAVFGLMAFVGPVWNVAIDVYRLTITPDLLLGRAQSAVSLLAYGALPLGSLLGGYLLASLGVLPTGLVLAGCMLFLACAAALTPAIRSAPTLDRQGDGSTPGAK
jgi:MFS family permease